VAVIANIVVIIVDNKLNAIIHEDKRLLRQALVLYCQRMAVASGNFYVWQPLFQSLYPIKTVYRMPVKEYNRDNGKQKRKARNKMRYSYPDYYHEFQCTAGSCPDTCCAGWQITIDKKSLKKYFHTKGAFGNRLKNSIDREEACFYRYDNRCAFLNEDNLCDICLEMGEEHLCRTCARYPRHIEEYENVREISLSLSCPEAAAIILSQKDRAVFLSEEKEEKEETYQDFDFFLYTKLEDIRTFFFRILGQREKSMRERMAMITAMSHDLQRRISKGQLCDIDEMLKRYAQPAFDKKAHMLLDRYYNQKEKRYELIQEMMMTLHELEHLQDMWNGMLWNEEWILYGTMTQKDYMQKRVCFLEQHPQWELQKEQLLYYFIFTYFCGAVYDEKADSKLKMCMVHILLLEELLFASWITKEQMLGMEEIVKMVYQYAREVEHSDWNLEYMEELMRKRTVFSLENMLIVIQNG
jgi:lysine-N-methylase